MMTSFFGSTFPAPGDPPPFPPVVTVTAAGLFAARLFAMPPKGFFC